MIDCDGTVKMQIAAIQEIDVFDVAKLKDRTQRTLFSLRVDGVTVYSKSIFGFPNLNSGANTIGAFQNENKESLFAWIDPVSGEFLVTTDEGTFKMRILLPGTALVVLTLILKFSGIFGNQDMVILVIPVLLGALAAMFMKKRSDQKLELALRSALKTD